MQSFTEQDTYICCSAVDVGTGGDAHIKKSQEKVMSGGPRLNLQQDSTIFDQIHVQKSDVRGYAGSFAEQAMLALATAMSFCHAIVSDHTHGI